MRIIVLAAALLIAMSPGARAQVARPLPTPGAAAALAAPCERREANLGGIGRASVVAFTGAIFGDRVCATVANLAADSVVAAVADAPSGDALVSAALGAGTGATLAIAADGALSVSPAAGAAAARAVGPWVILPGGGYAVFDGDVAAQPRVVLAYAGARILLLGTSPVSLVDLQRVLRDQPDLFGADAIERAVVLASGPGATLALRADAAPFGTPGRAGAGVLTLQKR